MRNIYNETEKRTYGNPITVNNNNNNDVVVVGIRYRSTQIDYYRAASVQWATDEMDTTTTSKIRFFFRPTVALRTIFSLLVPLSQLQYNIY